MHVSFHGPAGTIEGLLDVDVPSPRAASVFAHPHPQQGGTMHTKAVFQGAKGLARLGCAVLRFNFCGIGASGGRFDSRRGEAADFRAALDFLHDRYPDVPLWAAGFSFGAWIALEAGARDPRVTMLIGIAPPVSREAYSWEHTLASTKPKFFVQGDLDTLCPLKAMWAFYGKLHEPKELVVIDGAAHLFEGKTRELGETLEELLA